MKPIIPIFFAIDNNYVPFFTVSLTSLKENRDKEKNYRIHVLYTSLSDNEKEKILKMEEKGFSISLLDVSEKVKEIFSSLSLRDYYTMSTYYRIFIPEMFSGYDKAIYLDSDTIINCDVSALYSIDLKDNYIAGVRDGAVKNNATFGEYTKKTLGIPSSRYFNAGVIVMNLKEMRKQKFLDKFLTLSKLYKFTVAQDQDYLNVLCYKKALIIEDHWNAMPIDTTYPSPKLIHFNLTAKPWHYKGIPYEHYFWQYALKTDYYEYLIGLREGYSENHKEKDKTCERTLIEMCRSEIDNKNNYYNTYGRIFN